MSCPQCGRMQYEENKKKKKKKTSPSRPGRNLENQNDSRRKNQHTKRCSYWRQFFIINCGYLFFHILQVTTRDGYMAGNPVPGWFSARIPSPLQTLETTKHAKIRSHFTGKAAFGSYRTVMLGFTPSSHQLLDRRLWCIENFNSKNFKKKTGDPERGHYQYLKFSIAQKKLLSFGCG
jgi:hypothetical protein